MFKAFNIFFLAVVLTLNSFSQTKIKLGSQSTGNAATATSLFSAPTKCLAGQFFSGIDSFGNSVNCTPIPAQVSSSPYQTYYVDSALGNDNNNGLSPSSPIATISKVNSLALTPGTTVAFKKNQEWHDTLLLTNSGNVGLPITYSSYGIGSQPIISAADTVNGWVAGTGVAQTEPCGVVFCSGFETSGLTDWTSVTQNGATGTLSTLQNNHGNSSFLISTSSSTSNTFTTVNKTIPATVSGNKYAVRFYIKLDSTVLPPNGGMDIVHLFAGNTDVCKFYIIDDANSNITEIGAFDTATSVDVVSQTNATSFVMSSWNEVELDFTPGSSGSGQIYINGLLVGSTSGVNLSSLVGVTQFSIGSIVGSLNAGAKIYEDDVKIANLGIASSNPLPIGTWGGSGLPTTTWKHPQTVNPYIINFSGVAGTLAGSASAISQSLQYFWDSSYLYVYSTVNPTSIVEVPQRANTLFTLGVSNISITGLEFRGSTVFNVECAGGTIGCANWNFTKNTCDTSYSNCLYNWPSTLANNTPISNWVVDNNTFNDNGGAGITWHNAGLVVATNNILLRNCSRFDDTTPGLYGQNETCAAIQGASDDQVNPLGSKVVGNYISGSGIGITNGYGGGIHPDAISGWDIENNYVENTGGSGIEIEKQGNHIVRYNTIVNGGTSRYGSGIQLRAGDGGQDGFSNNLDNILVEHNTSIGGWWPCNISIQNNNAPVRATNVTFRKNICINGVSGTEFYTDPGMTDIGNTYTQNSFGILPGTYALFVNGTAYSSYSTFDTALGYNSNNLQGNPIFINSSAKNYGQALTSPTTNVGDTNSFSQFQSIVSSGFNGPQAAVLTQTQLVGTAGASLSQFQGVATSDVSGNLIIDLSSQHYVNVPVCSFFINTSILDSHSVTNTTITIVTDDPNIPVGYSCLRNGG